MCYFSTLLLDIVLVERIKDIFHLACKSKFYFIIDSLSIMDAVRFHGYNPSWLSRYFPNIKHKIPYACLTPLIFFYFLKWFLILCCYYWKHVLQECSEEEIGHVHWNGADACSWLSDRVKVIWSYIDLFTHLIVFELGWLFDVLVCG
jgi:hypothetical protein